MKIEEILERDSLKLAGIFKRSQQAVIYWRSRGVPRKYWEKLARRYNKTNQDFFEFNESRRK